MNKEAENLVYVLEHLLQKIKCALEENNLDVLTKQEQDLIHDLSLWYDGYEKGRKRSLERLNTLRDWMREIDWHHFKYDYPDAENWLK